MAALSRLARIFLLTALASIALAASAAAASAANLVTYPAKVHVAGGITITTKHDFTGPCEHNQAWTIEAKADVEAHGRLEVETYGQKTVQSQAVKTPRGAVNKNTMSGYSETQLCPPDESTPFEAIDKPHCSSHTGTAVVSIGPDRRKKGPLRVALGIARIGGGDQNPDCEGLQSPFKPTPGGELSALGSVYSRLQLPLGITASEVSRLKVGKKLTARIEIGGTCEGGGVIAAASVYREDTCEYDGSFIFEMKRLPGKGRGGFTTAASFVSAF